MSPLCSGRWCRLRAPSDSMSLSLPIIITSIINQGAGYACVGLVEQYQGRMALAPQPFISHSHHLKAIFLSLKSKQILSNSIQLGQIGINSSSCKLQTVTPFWILAPNILTVWILKRVTVVILEHSRRMIFK